MMEIDAIQRAICEEYGSAFHPVPLNFKVGIALSTLKLNPIYGVREAVEADTTGWYIWGGEYSSADDFFEPVHVAHLANLLPMVLPFLCLESGFKFIIDERGYKDIWRDVVI
jgi:hypothetical protein